MDELQNLNDTWEQHLDDQHAQLWERMKDVGATAEWTDPLDGDGAAVTDQPDDASGPRWAAVEMFQFEIQLEGEPLMMDTVHRVDPYAMASDLVEQAAIELERRGILNLDADV
ncbi:hypothetical protein E7T09_04150 [Deinococcus sp. KSM4-11]|uniref:hypothetical protein n=1 Tax=Deinococcus sp. KSM4-11 TaxID=2568654 RepID=UPI0010A5951B|nr:hypothetical protein [Deinococcus sp. KSM4-11]THF88406.1 hypothetical protein E7T09_04150 [Deinococcus sp. KSM4-11]